jgi:hypothetical protein
LAFRADVEEPGPEPVGHREPGEDERRGPHERLADLPPAAEGAVEKRGKG